MGRGARGRRVGDQGIRRSGDSAARRPVEKSGEQGIRKLGDRPAKYAKSAEFFRQDNRIDKI